ncbi:MAG: diguanylate cyclase (GGDEF)-like protein/PAS domain S-box-containing protein [Bermanella sp.]|jgi:diguanylate cyclase (GGDEF)-like protein/PAS domain S-box-containing protein
MSLKEIIINKNSRVISLIWIFFIFLVLVQGVSLYFQASHAEEKQQQRLEAATSSMAVEASNKLWSQLSLIKILLYEYSPEVDEAKQRSILNQLDEKLRSLLGDYIGFIVFDSKGELIFDRVVAGNEFEKSYAQSFLINKQLKNSEFSSFEISQSPNNEQNKFYFNLKITADNGQVYYFVMIRNTQFYTREILGRQSERFERWLVERDTLNVVISSSEIYDYSNRKSIDQLKGNKKLVDLVNVKDTPWQVAILTDGNVFITEAEKLLPTYIFFTLVYLVLGLIFKLRVYLLRKKYGVNIESINNLFKCSQQALSCIDEAVITTTNNGKIIYCNTSARKWLGDQSVFSIIDKPISEIFPFKGMPWLVDMHEYNNLNDIHNHGDTHVDLNGKVITLNISQHFSNSEHNAPYIIWVLRDITRESNNKELLDISQARYQALFNGCDVGIWHIDISLVREWLCNINVDSVKEYISLNPNKLASLYSGFHILEINDGLIPQYLGLNKEQLIKKTEKIIYENNKTDIVKVADYILKKHSKFSLQSEFKGINGLSRWFLVNITLDLVGKDQALLSFIDITDRVVAEKALKQSELFWSQVVKTLPDTVYVNDMTTTQTHFNSRHIGEILGYENKDLAKYPNWRELLHPDDIGVIDSAMLKTKGMAPAQINEANARLKHMDGSWRMMRFRDCVFSEMDSSMPRYYVGTVRDITEEEDAKDRLQHSERQYRLLAEGMSDVIFTLDLNYQISYVSSSIKKMLGLSVKEVIDQGLSLLFSVECQQQLKESLKKGLDFAKFNPKENSPVETLDLESETYHGLPIILETQINILKNECGNIEGILVTCRDVTQKRTIEKDARTTSEVFDNSSESIMVTDATGKITKVNKAFTSLTGFERDQIIGSRPSLLLSPSTKSEFLQNIDSDLRTHGHWQGEIDYRNSLGESRPSWTVITVIKDDLGKIQTNIIVSSDIADRKTTAARIEKLAYFDPLTGLPNRSQMQETLERFMVEKNQILALLFIDLDRFKPINDTMGHPAGDKVLKEVAKRLAASVRPQDLVARIGGDEFTVIMPTSINVAEAMDAAIGVSETILDQMTQPFVIEDHQLYLSASVGVAIFPENAISGMDLLRNADTAMYHAKAMGKNNFQFYAEEMNIKAMERLELENNLHLALRRNEFELCFQAQWDIKENKLCGLETLLRWRRPNHGIVGPDKFIPIIEETGLIVPIGEWVLRAACEQMIEWQETGFTVPKVAVNLSARQFKDPEILDRICRIVDETGVDPELIELELTESILMDDVERTLAVLNEARNMGFSLSIDDFGTGYSSLSYLRQFPVNNLKIDQSFIRNLPYNEADGQITRTIVAMANNLGLGVIAEGVETLEQRKFLEEIGCYKLQGFMYSQPVSADVIAQDFLDTEHEYYLEQ